MAKNKLAKQTLNMLIIFFTKSIEVKKVKMRPAIIKKELTFCAKSIAWDSQTIKFTSLFEQNVIVKSHNVPSLLSN